MERIAARGLLKIELPGQDVLLCDGGFVDFAGDRYRGKDPLFGTLASVEVDAEGEGDTIPAAELELLPPATAAIADLSRPGYQTSRVRFWIGEYDVASNALSGTPDLMFDGQVDRTTLRIGRRRTLTVGVVSSAERLFELNIGNTLNPGFHKKIWPGEKGHDNATGLTVPVAWGVESPARGSGSGGGAYGNGDGRFRARNLRQY